MRTRVGYFCLMLALGAGFAAAQVRTPNYGQMYCSGVYSTETPPYDIHLISGEEARSQMTFQQGNYVYISKGASQGVKAGDEFLVTRPVKDLPPNWFRWQAGLRRAMGRLWKDLGKLRVVSVEGNTAIAQIVYSCDYLQRGDYVRPFEERATPPLYPATDFDRFAPPSGRETAMVVDMSDFAVQAGTNDIVYVNLGSGQGVKVGDYFRFFRYQGTRDEMAYLHWAYQYRSHAFGSAPRSYGWKELPRENIGEGMVLRTGPNSSTVLVTFGLREIYPGDFVELQNPRPIPAEAAPAAAEAAPAANNAPALTCAAERPSVIAGERVRVSGQATDADGDPLTFAWQTSAGQLFGSGFAVTLDTTGLSPGRYTVSTQVNDGRGGTADCAVDVTVEAPPPTAPPQKIGECFFRAGSAAVDNVCKRILDDVATRLKGDPRARLVIVGQADPGEAGAAQLAMTRAENAKQYLLMAGVADARVETRGAPGEEGAGRQNRRTDFVWVPPDATY